MGVRSRIRFLIQTCTVRAMLPLVLSSDKIKGPSFTCENELYYIYIYIYVRVCVCVCVKWPASNETNHEYMECKARIRCQVPPFLIYTSFLS